MVINITSVTDTDYENQYFVILDICKDPVISYSVSPVAATAAMS